MFAANDMDSITEQERRELMGYCERDKEWWDFIVGVDSGLCPKCGDKPSTHIGFQLLTQRSYDPRLHDAKNKKKRG